MESVVARVSSSAPVAFEDGLGQRRVAIGVDGQTLELLMLRESLTATPSFEFALRDRVSRLATFQSDRYARVLGVERIGKGSTHLALASEHVAGVRLSVLLAAAESRLLPIETNAALSLVRQLAHAVAALHDRAPDLCHGAIGPERIIVTPNARLVLVEHVLGSAIEQLRYSNAQYWRELRVPLPRTIGAPHFDRRTDVAQVGATALALVVGRPIADDEFPDRVSDLMAGAISVAAAGDIEPLPLPLRVWLQRALQIESRTPFGSAPEARAELDRVLHYSDPIAELEALKLFLARYQASLGGGASATEPRPVATRAPVVGARLAEPTPAPPAASSGPKTDVRVEASVAAPVRAPERVPEPPTAAEPVPEPSVEAVEAPGEDRAASGARRVIRQAVPVLRAMPRERQVAAALLFAILTSGGTMAARRLLAPAVELGTLVVQSNPTGARVAIDDEERGLTPLNLELEPGDYTLTLTTRGNVRSIPITIAPGAYMQQVIELPRVSSVLGALRVQTEPAGAHVIVDGHAYGSSPMTVEGLPPGAHTVVLESAHGRVTQDVRIEAGATASLMVPLVVSARPLEGAVTSPAAESGPATVPATESAPSRPSAGWVSIPVPVALQVYENGELLGDAADRLSLAAGSHELLLLSEELGYTSTVTVDVAPGAETAVPVTWPSGSLAVNASPWAEVWIDGERAGETPLGNVTLPVGPHDLVFRHPELGERRMRAVVRADQPAKVTLDLRN